MIIESLAQRVLIEETIKAIEFIEKERDLEKVKKYIEEIIPFGSLTTVKYRNKFIQRFLEVSNNEVIYSPLLIFINKIDSFQAKKDVIYFIVCSTSSAVGEVIKGFYNGVITSEIDSDNLYEVFNKSMPNAKESSIKKTFSVVTTILNDFNILSNKTSKEKKKIYVLNNNLRPTNEAILFSIYYEFLNLKQNKMPDENVILDCDTFKYFLINDLLKKRYIKWMIDNGYIEYYAMGGNSKYQFSYDDLETLVKKVISSEK